jgi:hypothetical protein
MAISPRSYWPELTDTADSPPNELEVDLHQHPIRGKSDRIAACLAKRFRCTLRLRSPQRSPKASHSDQTQFVGESEKQLPGIAIDVDCPRHAEKRLMQEGSIRPGLCFLRHVLRRPGLLIPGLPSFTLGSARRSLISPFF